MRKGGLHKPLILDKYSAEDLNPGIMKPHDVKRKPVNTFRARPAISREPAGTEEVNPLRGEEQQKGRVSYICFTI
jgi:hypothetical protein